MLAHAKDLIKDAFKRSYAVGSFNTCNLEMTQGIVNAANKQNKNYYFFPICFALNFQ